MTNMNPTLMPEMTGDMLVKLQEKDGSTIEQAETVFRRLISKVNPAEGIRITFDRMRIVANGEIIEDYAGVMASRFLKDGLLYVIMNDGNVIPIAFDLVD